jgi:retron-type reverse transcriptase
LDDEANLPAGNSEQSGIGQGASIPESVWNADCGISAVVLAVCNKRAASGVDRKDVRSYQENLQENIEGLVGAVQGGWYRAKLVLRRDIPKLNGKMRPLGIPAIADKLLQIGVSKILEAIFEADFLGYSYG